MSATISNTAIGAASRRRASRELPIRVARFVVQLWLRHTERRVAMTLQALGHEGVLDDARAAGLPRF